MANTLTNLLPDLYASLDTVSRELVGFIPSVALDASPERAAVNQSVRVPMTKKANVVNVTPAMAVPEPTDQTVDNVMMTITKSRAAEFGWVGEEQRGLNTGPGYATIRNGQMLQAIRALTNEVEADLALAAYLGTSRAHGTAGTTPFASNLGDPAQVRKILADNGAPLSDMQMVIDTAAGASMRTLANLTKANEAGTTELREQGILLDIHGFKIRESGQSKFHTKGTGSGYTTNAAGYAVGATDIVVAGTVTGAIVAGDVITFAGDANKYVVVTGANAAGQTIKIAAPGLMQAIPAAATAISIGNSYAANVGFDRSAIILAARQPALPEEGDMALDRTTVVDPRSGLAFEVSMYPGYRKVRYEIALSWGVKVIKPEHTALLLG